MESQATPLTVVVYPDPVLRRGGQPVTAFGPELKELAARMFEAMYEEGGVGLAAPQVAIEHKLLVLNPSGSKDDRGGELVLLNPRITRKKGREYGEEGCLSFPGIYAEVERFVDITVTYQDLDGAEQTLTASDWLSRIIQHELDHLEGVLFVDRLSPADKLRVRGKLEELEERYARR
ncbi:MAG: peptide deformylase [Planctomycetota bacterium]